MLLSCNLKTSATPDGSTRASGSSLKIDDFGVADQTQVVTPTLVASVKVRTLGCVAQSEALQPNG